MNWSDKFLSRATFFFVVCGIVGLLVIVALIIVANTGLFPEFFDLSRLPQWIQALAGLALLAYFALDAWLLLRNANKGQRDDDDSICEGDFGLATAK